MARSGGYADGNALWMAARDRASKDAAAHGLGTDDVLRQFVMDRLVARVFKLPGDEWVLKGGGAVLARVHDARATKDVDLMNEIADLNAAFGKLEQAAALDLGDHFHFFVSRGGEIGGPAVAGTGVAVVATCGDEEEAARIRFSLDLVAGSVMTAEPDVVTLHQLVPSVPAPTVRIYPLVDHIADKVCATYTRHDEQGKSQSTRVRDLADLVIFARTQRIDGSGLITAIEAGWAHNGFEGSPFFDPPQAWGTTYPPLAQKAPGCGDVITFDAAVERTSALLDPVFDGSAAGRVWSPEAGAWTSLEGPDAPRPPTRQAEASKGGADAARLARAAFAQPASEATKPRPAAPGARPARRMGNAGSTRGPGLGD